MANPILVVDDDDSILNLVQMTLEGEGYDVITASDGSDALALLEEQRPKLILLDMRMSRVNGWEFAEACRKLPIPRAPIVVITAARDASQQAADIGADDFLAKPFDLDDLLAVVEKYLS